MREWSTDCVGAAQRLDYWVGAICEAFLEMDCSSREAPSFDGALCSLPVDTLVLNRVRASTQDVYRTDGAIARGAHHPFYLIAQSDSAWHVRQGGQVAHLRPGDVVLVDSAHRYELHFPHSVRCLSVQLPRAWVGQWLAQPDAPAPRVVWRDSGWGRSLSALSLQLAEDPASALAMPPAVFTQHLGALLSAALEPARAPEEAGADLYVRACALLQEQLERADLEAAMLAAQLQVGLRTLHRGFARHGASFAGTLRRLRLERAAELLVRPSLARLGVAEIGRRCGFSDASHFGREFLRQWGQTPARWRRQAR